jgi:hypothetical protein
MNAPLQVSETAPHGDIADFLECCEQQAWFYDEGWITLQTAVDNLQYLGDRWGLVDEIGQDAVQGHMAYTFAVIRETVQPLSYDYAAQILKSWEASYIEPPPMRPERRRDPAESTIAAFKYVLSLGDAEYLAKWLRDHSDDAAALVEQIRREEA